MAGTTKSRRSKRRRSSSSSSSSSSVDIEFNNDKDPDHDDPDHDDNDDNDDKIINSISDVLLLDGVEYKNYNDFVAAKRQRNENYLKGLGFHSSKNNSSNKKKQQKRVIGKNNNSNNSNRDVEAEASNQEATVTTVAPQGKLVSPVSSYYERYTNNDADENSGGMSFDGASRFSSSNSSINEINPFYEVSRLLLRLEREQQHHQSLKLRSLTKLGRTIVLLTNEGKYHVPDAAKATIVELDADGSYEEGGGNKKSATIVVVEDESSPADADADTYPTTIGTSPAAAAMEAESSTIDPTLGEAATAAVTATAQEEVNKTLRKSKSSAKAIILLLEEILARMAPPTSIQSISISISTSLHCREGYLDAFHQLNGVPLLLRLLKNNARKDDDDDDEEDKNKDTDLIGDDGDSGSNIVLLCLGIFREVCCLSAPQTKLSPSTSEKLSLDLVEHDDDEGFSGGFLETLYAQAESSMKEIITIVDTNYHPRETEAAAANAKAMTKQRKALNTTFYAWSVYANLTYFESVTASMGKKDLLHLADLAYWTVAALDCHVTNQLVRFLPLATTSSELENHLVKTKNISDTSCDNANDSVGSDLAAVTTTTTTTTTTATIITSPEAVNETMHIATDVSRVLEPVLTTIRNLVADPVAAPLDWEAKSLVSKLLDVLCKGEEITKEEPTKSRTEEGANANANDDVNDWLHFVKQTCQPLPEVPPNEDASPETTVFRWMEESEGTVWELLGVFKVCLGKGILYTSVHDVERLVGVWIRCLSRFGGSSSRIVVRVLGLVDGLVLPYGEEEERDEEEESSSSSAGVRKQILLREGFLDALVDLSSRYSLEGDCDGEAVRTEIESMIRRLR